MERYDSDILRRYVEHEGKAFRERAPRQYEVYYCLVERGMTLRQTADALGITYEAVRWHLHEIRRKARQAFRLPTPAPERYRAA